MRSVSHNPEETSKFKVPFGWIATSFVPRTHLY